MRVTDLAGQRYEMALERFRLGEAVQYEHISVRVTSKDTIECCIAASWQPRSINEDRARQDFASGIAAFEHLLRQSPQFAGIVEDRPVSFELIQDYGTGGVKVAELVHDRVIWAPGFPLDEHAG